MKTEPNEPINSIAVDYTDRGIEPARTSEFGGVTMGLTKREYFATKAMQGLLANGRGYLSDELSGTEITEIAETSCLLADALINQLNK